jgi:uncharacterized protein YvpB
MGIRRASKWIVALVTVGGLFGMFRQVSAEQLPPYVLLDLRGRAQQMPLSCESRSAVDLAAFWGVSIPEREFFDRLPKTDNPHTGFVGDVYEPWGRLPPHGYGVHAEPVAELLRAYGLPAEVRYGLGLDGLRAELAAGRPVIIWATPRMANQPVEKHVTSDGQTVDVVRYEHTVIAVGYNQSAVYVVDAGNGRRWVYGNEALLGAWDKLRQMSVVLHGQRRAAPDAQSPPSRETSSSPPATSPADSTIVFQNPSANSAVRVPLEIRGTVQVPGLEHYQVWYGAGDSPTGWEWVSGPHQFPVQDGLITPVQLEWLPPGRYTLRLVVYGENGRGGGQIQFTIVP